MRRLLIIFLTISYLLPIYNAKAQTTEPVWIYYVEKTEGTQTIWRTNAYNPTETEQLFITPNVISASLAHLFPANEISALLDYAKDSIGTNYWLPVSFEDLLPEQSIDVEIRQIKVSSDNKKLAFVVAYTHCFSMYRRPETCFGYSNINYINTQNKITLLEQINQTGMTEPYDQCTYRAATFTTMFPAIIDWTLENEALYIQVTNRDGSCQSGFEEKPVVVLPIDTNQTGFIIGEEKRIEKLTTSTNHIIINRFDEKEISIIELDIIAGGVVDEETYHFEMDTQTADGLENGDLIIQLGVEYWAAVGPFSGFVVLNRASATSTFIQFFDQYENNFTYPEYILYADDEQITVLAANQLKSYDLVNETVNIEAMLPEILELTDRNQHLKALLYRDTSTGQFALYDYQLYPVSEFSLPVAPEHIELIDF